MKKTLLKMSVLAALAGAFASGCATQPNNPGTQADASAKPYPLDYCLVSGDKIGAMGKPITIVYQGQEIKFCCPDCPPDFKKDPDKYMKKLAAEQAKGAAK